MKAIINNQKLISQMKINFIAKNELQKKCNLSAADYYLISNHMPIKLMKIIKISRFLKINLFQII